MGRRGSQSTHYSNMLDLRTLKKIKVGFPGSASGKEPACQCRRHKRPGFGPWIGKIPWRRAWQPYVINHDFTDEDTETQRDKATWPRSHSRQRKVPALSLCESFPFYHITSLHTAIGRHSRVRPRVQREGESCIQLKSGLQFHMSGRCGSECRQGLLLWPEGPWRPQL